MISLRYLPVLVVLLLGCGGKSGGPAATDGGSDGGGDARGDGGGDLASERPRDGGALDGPVACNGRCAGNCVGVCTGICLERTAEGECSGRCEEICVGMCAGTCTRMARGDGGGDGPSDGPRDAASERRPDGGVLDGGGDGSSDAPVVPATGWVDRANTSTLSWPPAGHSGAMVFDASRGKVVMFGGATTPGNATWEWDGMFGAWELRQQMSGDRPSRRYGHAMAYDAGRRKVVLHGGIDETGGSNNETWEWDGTAETWTRKANGPSPSRWGHAMAYHADLARIVMFGGAYRHPTLGDGDLFDIWEYDGARDAWVNKTYPLPPSWPRARRGHAMAYDPSRMVTIMYGGDVLALGGPVADLWEWDSTTNQWTDRTPPAFPAAWPGPRVFHGLVHADQRVLLHGAGHLWAWNGAAGTWQNLTPANILGPWPPTRARSPLAWDEARQVLVLSGGSMMVGANALADLWEYAHP